MTIRPRISAAAVVLAVISVSAASAAAWTTIATFSGSGTQDTAAFTATGGNLRFDVTVQPNSSGPVPLLLKMYPKGAPVDAHERVRLQCIDCKGPQILDAGKVAAGTYFVHVTTSRPWTMKVEENSGGR
ncbi:MAG: hypothetical protein ACRD1V_14690 [Vicinamibacterales bacterium]